MQQASYISDVLTPCTLILLTIERLSLRKDALDNLCERAAQESSNKNEEEVAEQQFSEDQIQSEAIRLASHKLRTLSLWQQVMNKRDGYVGK
jgi:hypothetical protein